MSDEELDVFSAQVLAGGHWQWIAMKLISEEPRHGYDILSFFERTLQPGPPGPSAVYPFLRRMVDESLVSVRNSGKRRIYTITDAGLRYLDAGHPMFAEMYETCLWQWKKLEEIETAFSELEDSVAELTEPHFGEPRNVESVVGILKGATAALHALSS